MSYLSIENFIQSGRKSLEDKNYWSALSVALALPSMCSRIAFCDDEETYKNFKEDKDTHSKKYTTWKDKKCYIDFCKNIMSNDSWFTIILGNKFAEILYQIRCDIIHAGEVNVYDNNKGIHLVLGETTTTLFSKYTMINIKDLCDGIFDCVETWRSSNSIDNFKYTYVFDIEHNNNDRILYTRLCEEDKADKLKKDFDKENEERKLQR